MIILASTDNETYHRIDTDYIKLSKRACDEILSYIEKKEETPSPLNKPLSQRRKKRGKPPLPPLSSSEKSLWGEPLQQKTTKKNSPPYADIYDLAKKAFPDWSFRTTTDKRNRRIRRLWNANGKSSLVFDQLFKMAKASDFLNSRNGHGFKGRLSISWVIERAEEILDGKYDNERMAWALDKKNDLVDAVVIGVGRTKVDPSKGKHIGEDEVTGLPKFIIKQD